MDKGLWRREVLSNGIRVLRYPRLSDMTVQLAVAMEYGSNADSRDASGTAHFLEHMLAGGSNKRIELSREIERLGGSSDFITTNEYTINIVNIVPKKVAKASHILSGLVFDSSFEQEKFELERKIILNEITEVSDYPYEKINEMLKRCLFKTHPIKQPICGYRKTINQLSLNEIVESHQTHYTPQNMILILTGRFSDKDVEIVLQDFSDKNNQKPASKKAFCLETSKPKKEITLKRLGIHQTYMSMGVRTVHIKHPDTPAIDLINTLIGSGASSRLFIELREKRALTYSIRSSHECGMDYGYFHIDCAIKHRNLEKTMNLVHKEVERIKTDKVSKNELNQGKDMIKGEICRALDSPSECPEILAEMEMWFNSKNAILDYFERIDAVTADEICKTANKYLGEGGLSTAILTPS